MAAAMAWLVVVGVIAAVFRDQLRRLWMEPVLRNPVLVIESDDWGAGPLAQAEALSAIEHILCGHRDAVGRAPCLNLALVLAVPDAAAISSSGGYHAVELDAPVFAPVLLALRAGASRGVFSLQLHGLEHYWPPALMRSTDPAVRSWLIGPAPAVTEQLPAHLQSRWVDASVLPSVPLPDAAIHAAAADEVAAFERIVGRRPAVVVPPTFVWTHQVERAWAAEGIECIVTPGWRSTQRNAGGQPDTDEGPIVNGSRGTGGVTYLVRTDYFEPSRGRDAGHALRALARTAGEGRACILENHRDNFIGDAGRCHHSLRELDTLFSQAFRQHPGLRCLSTAELAQVLRDRHPDWLVERWRERLPFVWQRLRHSGRLWRLMKLTGMAVIGGVALRTIGLSRGGASAASAR